jgi:hypothetical protein
MQPAFPCRAESYFFKTRLKKSPHGTAKIVKWYDHFGKQTGSSLKVIH